MASKLEQAVEIFVKLGWEEANLSETPTLNIGTKEEQKIAKEGLKSGEWGEFREISPNTYGYVELVDVDMEKLSLFAIRVGVDAKRAVNILTRSSKEAFEIICARGEKYATDFIASACVSSRRGFEHSATRFADLCVKLVYELNLEIPQNLEYIKDWAVITGRVLGLDVEDRALEENKFDLDLDYLKTRFQEHIKMAISVNAPATGPFSEVLTEGVKRALLSREFALEQIFFALDASIRQGDRKAWLKALEKLNISEEEILAREQNLIPVLSMGDSFLIETFAPVLIHGASEELIPSILISSFSCKVKKTLQMILKTAAERKKPEHAEDLKEWIFELTKEEDKKISSAATLLAKKWNLQMQEHESEESEILGLWQETPKLWTVPKCNLSSKTLSELIIEHSKRKVEVHDLDEERLLALTNHMARNNPKDTKLHFVGVRNHDILLYALVKWAKNEVLKGMIDNYNCDYSGNEKKPVRKGYSTLIYARNTIVIKHIETLPCILSTPSFDDLSISFSDLKSRILTYVQNGVSYVFEPDLQLALARLDVKSAKKEEIEELKNLKSKKNLKLSVKLPSGRELYEGNELYEFDEVDLKSNFEEDKRASLMEEFNQKNTKNHKMINAIDVILEYLKEPFKEPEDFYSSATKYWGYDTKMQMPEALKDFPYRLHSANDDSYSIFPMFGDFVLTRIRRDTEVYHGQGLILKQAVRRRAPFPKAASINLLAIGSYLSDENAQDVLEAIHEAWERGLLLPKVADVNLLDWDNEVPSNLASFAKSLDDRAQEGMLSAVWPVINDMIALSLKQQRMISGTADLVKLAKKYLPEVLYAVKTGAASAEELKMEGIGALSKKSGSSIAITTAKEIMEMFSQDYEKVERTKKSEPAKENKEKKKKQEQKKKEELLEIRIPETSFDLFWKYYPKENPILEDGVKMEVTSVQTMASKKGFVFDLFLPDVKDKLYKVFIYDWVYSLESEGQVTAIECPIDVKEYQNDLEKQLELVRDKEHQVWLYYDAKKKKICVSNFRNTEKEGNGPLQRAAYPLSSTLKTISLALIAQDGESIYSALRLVREFVKDGEIGVDTTKMAMAELLEHEDVSPAKLIRVLEQETELFSALWPILTTSIEKGGQITEQTKKIPTWINRVLDNCLYNAYYLKEAMRRGQIPKEEGCFSALIREKEDADHIVGDLLIDIRNMEEGKLQPEYLKKRPIVAILELDER